MGKQSNTPPPPDYTGIAAASERYAQQSYRLAERQFALARQQYAEDRAWTNRISGDMLAIMRQNQNFAIQDREHYNRFYKPMEREYAQASADYNRLASQYGRESEQAQRAYERMANTYDRRGAAEQRQYDRAARDFRREGTRTEAQYDRIAERYGDRARDAMREARTEAARYGSLSNRMRNEYYGYAEKAEGLTQRAAEGYNRAIGEYRGLERGYRDEAKRLADPRQLRDRQEYEAAKAQAAVAQQFEGAREAAIRQLEGFGINPSATRYQALNFNARVQNAAARAAAGNVAREQEEVESQEQRRYAEAQAGAYDAREMAAMGARNAQVMAGGQFAMGLRGQGNELMLQLDARRQAALASGRAQEAAFLQQQMDTLRYGDAIGLQFDDRAMAAQGRGDQLALEYDARARAARDQGYALDLAYDQRQLAAMGMADSITANALNIGRGYPGQITAQYGTATGTGSNIVGNQATTSGTGFNNMGTGYQWGTQGTAGYAGATNAYGGMTDYQKMMQDQTSGWLTLAGTALGAGAKVYGMQHGGAIPADASPSRGAVPDDAIVRTTPGEFVVPKEAVEWYGQKHFAKLIEKAKEERAQAIPV